ncbi:DNA polymerase III subunit alpha, partial [Streptomyces sp. NPDC050610]
VSTQLVEDTVVFVKGRLDKREDVPRLVAMEMAVPDLSDAGPNAPVRLEMPESGVTPASVGQLAEILRSHPGRAEVHLRVRGKRKTTVYRLGQRVEARPEFWADLKAAVAVTRVT